MRSSTMMRLASKQGFVALAATIAAMMGTSFLVQSIPYEEGFGPKQMAWMLHTATIGAVIAPLCAMGGPLAMRAAFYTASVIGGLSTIAYCAPGEKFLYIGGPLAIGLGVVFASSIGTHFLPPTTALGAGIYSIAVYGGLVLFSMFLLYDTQRIIKEAQQYSTPYYDRPYDPINR